MKRGETNGGEFIWPSQDLVLREKKVTTATRIQWFPTTPQKNTCSAICQAKGGTCSANTMRNSLAKQRDGNFLSASKSITCSLPYISMNGDSCTKKGLLMDGRSNCFYRDDQSKCPGPSTTAALCESAAASGSKQMCACELKTDGFSAASQIR